MASKWDKYKVTEEENKWDKYKTTPQQSGQQSYRESVANRNADEGVFTPARVGIDAAAIAAKPLDWAAKGVDFLSGGRTQLSKGIDDVYQGAQGLVSGANRAVNTLADQQLSANQERKDNWDLASGFKNPVGWLTEELPSTIAGAVKGVSDMQGGLVQGVEGAKGIVEGALRGDIGKVQKSGTNFLQGFTDSLTGSLAVIGSPAPLLPDFLEKPTMHAFGGAMGMVDTGASKLVGAIGIDPESPVGSIFRQNIQNGINVLTLNKAPKAAKQAGKATTGMVEGVLSPVKKTYDTETAGAFKKMGVEPTVSMVNDNRVVNFLETIQSKSYFGQKLTDVVNNARDGIQNALQEQIEKISGIKTTGEYGVGIMDGLKDFKKNFQKVKNNMFAEVDKVTTGIPSRTKNTVGILDEVQKNMNESSWDNPYAPKMKKLIDDFTSPEGRTFSEVRATLSDIKAEIRTASGDPIVKKNIGILKKLEESLELDLMETIEVVDKPTGALLKQANTYYRENIQKINSYFGEKIWNAESLEQMGGPENLVDVLVKPKNSSIIPSILESIGEEGTTNLRGAFLTKMAQKAIDQSTGEFSPRKFTTELGRYGDDVIRELFTDEQYRNIQLLEKMSQGYTRSQKIAQGSQTAFIGKISGSGAILGAGIFTGNAVNAIAGVVGLAIMDYGFSKFLNSKFAKQWLGEGFDQQVIDAVSGTVQNATQGVKEYIDETKQNIKEKGSTRGSIQNPFGNEKIMLDRYAADVRGLVEAYKKHSSKMRENSKMYANPDATIKGYAMKDSAILRKLREEPTPTEISDAVKYLKSNYKGKIVSVDGKNGVVQGNAYGRIKVQFEDGTIKNIYTDDIQAHPVNNTDAIQFLKESAKKEAESILQLYSFRNKTNKGAKIDPLIVEAKKYKSVDEFVKSQETPKTINVLVKSKFSNQTGRADFPVIRKEENITLYQGGKTGDHRQFWTSDKKYAAQFGEVKEKTGTFYKVDNGNRVTDVYVEAPTKQQLQEIYNQAHNKN